MKKNILILGGTRFIGYLLLLKLTNEGHNVTIHNRKITKPPGKLPNETKIVKGDRDNKTNFKELFVRKFDCIVDLSGFTEKHVKDIIENYSEYINHYIFISSTSVYKESKNEVINEKSEISETKNSYGSNKNLAESFLLKNSDKVPTTIFRPNGVFGPYDPCLSGLIIYRIINNLPILTENNLEIKTNKIFVLDLINIIILSINNKKFFGKTYNIAGEKISLNEFINICSKVCKKKAIINDDAFLLKNKNINFIQKKRHVNFHTEWPKNNIIYNNQKIKTESSYNFTSYEKSIEKTYIWLNNDKKRLNYFSLKYEYYILNNKYLPLIKKYKLRFSYLVNNLILTFKKNKLIMWIYRKIKK